ncbi:MAG: hypothetical protein Q4A54_01080 [Parabacteroides sp.]|nr:hypothetical protein [Parabacteroides sp.]
MEEEGEQNNKIQILSLICRCCGDAALGGNSSATMIIRSFDLAEKAAEEVLS